MSIWSCPAVEPLFDDFWSSVSLRYASKNSSKDSSKSSNPSSLQSRTRIWNISGHFEAIRLATLLERIDDVCCVNCGSLRLSAEIVSTVSDIENKDACCPNDGCPCFLRHDHVFRQNIFDDFVDVGRGRLEICDFQLTHYCLSTNLHKQRQSWPMECVEMGDLACGGEGKRASSLGVLQEQIETGRRIASGRTATTNSRETTSVGSTPKTFKF